MVCVQQNAQTIGIGSGKGERDTWKKSLLYFLWPDSGSETNEHGKIAKTVCGSVEVYIFDFAFVIDKSDSEIIQNIKKRCLPA